MPARRCSCANRVVFKKPKRCCPKLSSGFPPSLVRASNGRFWPMPAATGGKPSGVGSSFAQSFRTTRQHTRSAPQGCASLNRYDEAETLVDAGRKRFPDDLGITCESAWLATHRRAWAEALRRWGLVLKQFP